MIRFDDLKLDDHKREQFGMLQQMLIEQNRHVNLTAITDPEQINEKHFADSLAIALWPGFSGTEKIIDIGCGAGFPGLPIKIAYPDVKITLMDSIAKKIAFVQDVIEELGLNGDEQEEISACAIHTRAEEIGRDPEHRAAYDLAVTRAVAPLAVLIEYALPLLKTGGSLIAYKQAETGEAKKATTALNEIGGELTNQIFYSVPGGESRELIIVRKTGETSDKYPRRTGKPAKSPIV